MKQGRTLTELAMELDRQRKAKKDYLLDTRSLTMDAGENGAMLTMRNEQTGTNILLKVNEIAHDQIGTALKIPAPYYDRMLNDYPELLAENVNRWFQKEPKTRMVRTLDGTARAFLSDRYHRIDNWDVAQTSLEVLTDLGNGLRIESCEVTDQKMYIKVVNPRLEAEVVPGDIVQSGLIISNSEVGRGQLSVQPLVYRLVCTNGMVVNDAATKRRHVGRRVESDEDFTLYSDETMKLDDIALMAKVRDTVRAIAEQSQFDKVVNLMRQANGMKMFTANVPAMIELTGKDFGYSKAEGESILEHLIKGGDLSLYGLSNAVTRAAQDVDSYDRSTEMESIGYSILGMSADKWDALNRMSVAGKAA